MHSVSTWLAHCFCAVVLLQADFCGEADERREGSKGLQHRGRQRAAPGELLKLLLLAPAPAAAAAALLYCLACLPGPLDGAAFSLCCGCPQS